jgi:hypothetical protein
MIPLADASVLEQVVNEYITKMIENAVVGDLPERAAEEIIESLGCLRAKTHQRRLRLRERHKIVGNDIPIDELLQKISIYDWPVPCDNHCVERNSLVLQI